MCIPLIILMGKHKSTKAIIITLKFAFNSSSIVKFKKLHLQFKNFHKKLTISVTSLVFSTKTFGVLNNRRQWSWLLTRRHVPSGDHLHPFKQFENFEFFLLKHSLAIFTSLGDDWNISTVCNLIKIYKSRLKMSRQKRKHTCVVHNKPSVTSSMKRKQWAITWNYIWKRL